MTLKLRRRMESFIQSGYYGKMSFKVYEALRGVGFASLFLLLTPITEYPCLKDKVMNEIVCFDDKGQTKAQFSIDSTTKEEIDRAEYMKVNREK